MICVCQIDPKQQASLEAQLKQKDEACREAEHRRVEVELQLVEVKENLKKAESGPFTLGTTLDSSLQDTHTVSRPAHSLCLFIILKHKCAITDIICSFIYSLKLQHCPRLLIYLHHAQHPKHQTVM